MKAWIKNKLKDKFLITKIRNRFNPSTQITQRHLFHYYQDCAKSGNFPKIEDCGHRVFSQYEEDGKLLAIFAAVGMKNKTFLEIGADDGVNSNSANLYFNFGFTGTFIDGNPKAIKRGQKFFSKYPHPWMHAPQFVCDIIKTKNINELVEKSGLKGDIGFMSIDIDGNDYWIWDALEVVTPDVVMIETHNEFGLNNIVVPYDENYMYPGKHPIYHGASPVAMTKLAEKKGYRLVGANELGFNFIFVKNGLAEDLIPAVSVASLLTHPSNKEAQKRFEPIKDWEFLEG
ncbi:MAG: hypothetical protein ACPGU5_03315 [Lishizhenia sp.]